MLSICVDAERFCMEKVTGKYENCSDEELVVRFQDGETEISDYIMMKYKPLVRSIAGSMFMLGAEPEDLIQEGMIGLFKALQHYDAGRDASFSTYANLSISRQTYTAVKAYSRKKHAPLNNYVSLYAGAEGSGEENPDAGIVNALASAVERNPEDILIDHENLSGLMKYIDQELSELEKQVLELRIIGKTYEEIARILGKDEKSIDNAMQRIRAKLKRKDA